MSIALDTALYLREQKLSNPLTLAERGILYTLMFRVGSNPFTWVSQATLAIEVDIAERNVKRLLSNIKKKGFIETMKDSSDKRKNLYRPAEFLINYHQQNNRDQSKKYGIKLSPNIEDRGQNYPLNRGQNYPLSHQQNSSQVIDTKEEKSLIEFPKAKEERNNKTKIKRKVVDNLIIPLWLNKESWNDFKTFRCEIKKPLSLIAEKRALAKLQKLKDQGYDPEMIIDRSIDNKWSGLFPYQINKNSYQSSKEPTPTRSTYTPHEIALENDRSSWEKLKAQSESYQS